MKRKARIPILLAVLLLLPQLPACGEISVEVPSAETELPAATADPNPPAETTAINGTAADTEFLTAEAIADEDAEASPRWDPENMPPREFSGPGPGPGAGEQPEFTHPEDRPWEYSTFGTAWTESNFSDTMKFSSGSDLDPFTGADLVERAGDHADSRYYVSNDWYNITSDRTLTILSHFKTVQQSDLAACGVDCALMVMEYFGLRNDWTEAGLLPLRSDHNAQHSGTCLEQLRDIFDAVGGFEYLSSYDYAPQEITPWLLRSFLRNGVPVIVGWSAWGGHWEVVIGYDDCGTPFYEYDDVLIFANPCDTTDHNQDGYTTYSAQEFFTEWTFYDTLPTDGSHITERAFIAAWPSA